MTANYLEHLKNMTDEMIREIALKEFKTLAVEKFNQGIAEHNPDGSKGLSQCSPLQLVQEAKKEAWDQVFYLTALEQQLIPEM